VGITFKIYYHIDMKSIRQMHREYSTILSLPIIQIRQAIIMLEATPGYQ